MSFYCLNAIGHTSDDTMVNADSFPVRALSTSFTQKEDAAFLKNLKLTHKSVMCSYPFTSHNLLVIPVPVRVLSMNLFVPIQEPFLRTFLVGLPKTCDPLQAEFVTCFAARLREDVPHYWDQKEHQVLPRK